MALETRRFATTFETRQDDEKEYRIVGRPVVIGQETDLGFCREIIEKDALKKTDLRDVLFFTNHDVDKIPLARSRRNNKNSTMTLTVTDEGLDVDALLDIENNTDARAVYSAIDRGDMTGMSFMFSIRGEEWEDLDKDKPLRHITDIEQIFEVSAVNFPAYSQTEISVRDTKALESVKRSLESARSAALLESKGTDEKRNKENELNLAKAKALALARRYF